MTPLRPFKNPPFPPPKPKDLEARHLASGILKEGPLTMHREIALPRPKPYMQALAEGPVKYLEHRGGYRDAVPAVEISSPPPPKPPNRTARIVFLAGVLGFLFGHALASLGNAWP